MVDYGLKDKVVLITGTNNPKGMGAAMALSYAEEGAKVAMVYKRMDYAYNEAFANGDGLDAYFKALSMDCQRRQVAFLPTIHL